MKKFYRRRLITVSMLAFLILFILVFSGMFLFSFLQMESETNRTVQFLLNPPENGGQMFEGARMPGAFDLRRGHPMFSSYYDITASEDGTVTACEIMGFTEETQVDIQAAVRQILDTGKTSGRWGTFKFGVQETEDGQMHIVLMNISIQLQMLFSMVRSALIIGTALLVLLFIILLPVTAKAASILIQNTEKQKQFITDAGHELKTPLTVISANMDVLQLETGENEWIRSTQKQVAGLRGLVNELIYLSRLDEEDARLQLSRVDLKPLVEEAAEPFAAMAEFSGKSLNVQASEAAIARGDPGALNRLVSVLCDNAVKYAPEGDAIEIALKSDGRRATLTVENGLAAPMDPEALKHLFDRFYRADASRSKERGGYGLGLSIARAVVEKHGGTIEARQTPENRLRFTVSLPTGGVKATQINRSRA